MKLGILWAFGKLQLVAALTFSPSQVQMCLKAWLTQRKEREIAIKLCCIENLEWAGELHTKGDAVYSLLVSPH